MNLGCYFSGPPLLWLVIDSEIDMMTSWDDEPDIVKETNRVRVFAQSLKKRALSTAYACAYQVRYYRICIELKLKASQHSTVYVKRDLQFSKWYFFYVL